MRMLPKPARKHEQGQADHIDAWLISYADLITLLFTLFVIFVSVTVTKYTHSSSAVQRGEPAHPYLDKHSGLMTLGTHYDELYRNLSGLVVSNAADQQIGVEKNERGITIDIAAMQFFDRGSANIPNSKLPLIHDIAQTIQKEAHPDDIIEVESYTDDTPLKDSPFSDNWELTGMRSAHVVKLLINEGLSPARLHAVSFADNDPLVPNRDILGNPIPENRNRNQRIVIRVEGVK